MEAHASISVPSTEKCSADMSLYLRQRAERGEELTRHVPLHQPRPIVGGGRMPDGVVEPEPTNQRNKRLMSICSVS